MRVVAFSISSHGQTQQKESVVFYYTSGQVPLDGVRVVALSISYPEQTQ